jgi:hypothetical protein
MPIEIKELHIRVSVNSPQSNPSSVTSGTTGNTSNLPDANREEMIAACVEKVMEIIQNKTER